MVALVDFVARGGRIFDGCGGEPFVGDVAIDGGIIVAIGEVSAQGREEVDASGCIVTPGFVDVHTHYDGHATWSDRLRPSSNHGVTTAVMGNCGVGFAPCRPADRNELIELMEGVEDIPGVVIREGLPWAWESFPQYLDFLSERRFDMDVAAYLPHAPLRVYVMGQRGLDREPASPEDVARMRELAAEAIAAGALGFATSRTINHKSLDGRVTPSYSAAEGELHGIVSGMTDAGAGVFQMISDFEDPKQDFAMICRVAEQSERRLTFSLLQMPNAPDRWEILLSEAEQAARDGLPVTAQVFSRPVGVLLGLELSNNPFTFCPSYQSIAKLPLADRLAAMRDPGVKARIISEYPARSNVPISVVLAMPDKMFLLGEDLNYEPDLDDNLAAAAERGGVPVAEYLYDLVIADKGRNIIYIPAANYVSGTIDTVETMLRSKVTVPGLGDGGAHCGAICDASAPTYMLLRWTREPSGRLSLPGVIKSLTSESAAAVELNDRGRIASGLRGDLNIIDLEKLSLGRPHIIYDLPSGAGRLNQESTGYVATIVAGEVTYRNGRATGALPGRLVRGTRPSGARVSGAA